MAGSNINSWKHQPWRRAGRRTPTAREGNWQVEARDPQLTQYNPVGPFHW